jgi:hypothetical protein
MMASVPVTEVGARGSQIGEKKSDSRSPRLPVLNQGSSILIREYQGASGESRSGIRVMGVSDRGPLASGSPAHGPTRHPGYVRDIRDTRNQDQGRGYQVPSLISLIRHRRLRTSRPRAVLTLTVTVTAAPAQCVTVHLGLELPLRPLSMSQVPVCQWPRESASKCKGCF